MKVILLLTLLVFPTLLISSEGTRYAKHGCFVKKNKRACEVFKKLTKLHENPTETLEVAQEIPADVIQKREIASIDLNIGPIESFNNYLSLLENTKADDYNGLEEFVSKEAFMNMKKHEKMIGFYFAMVKSKQNAGLYKNGELSINENEAKIIYSPVEYQDARSGKKRKTGATIYMVKVSERWLFDKEKGFTSIGVK